MALCPKCSGSGVQSCHNCHGAGTVPILHAAGRANAGETGAAAAPGPVKCPSCHGVGSEACRRCDGAGEVDC